MTTEQPEKVKKGHKGGKGNTMPDGKKKKQKNQAEREAEDRKGNDFEYKAADVDKVKETNVLFFEG